MDITMDEAHGRIYSFVTLDSPWPSDAQEAKVTKEALMLRVRDEMRSRDVSGYIWSVRSLYKGAATPQAVRVEIRWEHS